MTAEIVNLKRARKEKARAEKERAAAENRIRFGRSKAERDAQASEAQRRARVIEGHRRDAGEGGDDDAGGHEEQP